MNKNNLISESCFDNLNIMLIGDVILDHYLIGKVDRISPEAPVPVVLHESEDFRLGGAANVALNIKALGATPFLFSAMGSSYSLCLFCMSSLLLFAILLCGSFQAPIGVPDEFHEGPFRLP